MGSADGKSREISIGPFTFNPVVTLVSFTLLWGFAIWCMHMNGETEERGGATGSAPYYIGRWQTWVANAFNWFYMGSQNVWIFFGIYLYYYYGHLKLCARGDEDVAPEFSNSSYFVMVFTCGVAIGMFFFGVAEPVKFYLGSQNDRYNAAGLTDVEKAQWAMTQTIFHWGLHGWVPYQLVGCTLGFISYRFDKPLTMRTCFYPLIGNGIYGWVGDFIDIFSVVTIVMGVCTSLGMGCSQLLVGMLRLDETLYDKTNVDETFDAQATVILLITGLAALSVLSGVNVGIKYLAYFGFILGCFLMTTVFFFENTWAILNVFVQTFGHYIQYLFWLGHQTDGFAELGNDKPGSEGHPINGPPDGKNASQFMEWWTIFYWGWWIAWSPFVGTFIARISKGRTMREVVNYTLFGPCMYVLFWFSVFGTAGIRTQWTAMNLEAAGADFIIDNQTGVHCYVYEKTGDLDVEGNEFSTYAHGKGGMNLGDWSTMACKFSEAPSSPDYFFLLFKQYYGFERFLTFTTIVALITYFITSSDSGSYVVDLHSANGKEGHPVLKVMWAFTEGFLALALVKVGGPSGTGALQAMSICCGLPYTVLLCIMMVSLIRACEQEVNGTSDIEDASRPKWTFPIYGGICDIFEMILSLGGTVPEVSHVIGFAVGIIAPWMAVTQAQAKMGDSKLTIAATTISTLLFFYLAWSMIIAGEADRTTGLWAPGWSFYLMFVTIFAETRSRLRNYHGIAGNFLEDWFITLLLFPQAAAQMSALATSDRGGIKKDDDVIKNNDVEVELNEATKGVAEDQGAV
jgi:choline-glycine betaine transporter